MKIVRSLDSLPPSLRGGAVSIGNFDGVHQGHARIVSTLRERADAVNGPVIVFTFDPHPVRLLRPHVAPPPLTWTERKAELLSDLGVDAMIAYPTDEEVLKLTADDFFSLVVRQKLDARAMVEGPNFFFGRDRAGDVELLRQLCQRSGLELRIVEPLIEAEEFVSSSRVRKLIAEGRVQDAAAMLTQPYRIRGMVTHGARRGAKIGFPTANIDAIDTLLPGHGVYSGWARAEGERWATAVNVGPSPTFGEGAVKVEAHLIDFSGDLYGAPLEVDFLARLRDIQSFDSVEQLKAQLAIDIQRTRHK